MRHARGAGATAGCRLCELADLGLRKQRHITADLGAQADQDGGFGAEARERVARAVPCHPALQAELARQSFRHAGAALGER